jgi:hypothetical protein
MTLCPDHVSATILFGGSHGNLFHWPATCQQVSHEVVTAAMKVHNELGAGLLESAYLARLKFLT